MKSLALLAALTFAAAAVPSVAAANPTSHGMVDHAAFYSVLTRQDHLVDPEAFVRDNAAPAATGLGGIAHAAGFRNLVPGDDPTAPVFTADGRPMGIDAGHWFAAQGALTIDLARPQPPVTAAFSGLIPNGVYSLFLVTFGPGGGLEGAIFAPLDGGDGARSTFTADAQGYGRPPQLAIPAALGHANAIELIYHSDGRAHGRERGQPGVQMSPQLIWRVP